MIYLNGINKVKWILNENKKPNNDLSIHSNGISTNSYKQL